MAGGSCYSAGQKPVITCLFLTFLQYPLMPIYYQALLLAAYLMIILTESLRLYLGYIGNLQEKVSCRGVGTAPLS